MRNFALQLTVIALIAGISFIAGCSCSSQKNNFEVKAVAGRDYEGDSDELRKKSAVATSSGGPLSYLGNNMLKKERSAMIEKLQEDGRKALKNKYFMDAESLYSKGDYDGAMKMYTTAANSGNNIYIARRSLACKMAVDNIKAREDAEIKKAVGLMIEKRPDEALNVLNALEKANESPKDRNVYMDQTINSLKIKIYRKTENDSGFESELIKQQKILKDMGEKLSNSWTVPIER